MMKRLLACLTLALITCAPAVHAQDSTKRWSEKKIWDWYNQQPWYAGFNYIPAYAINYTAMWDKTSFDPKAIDKELALAEKSGMNVLRAVLQYAVYADDPAYFLKTLDTFTAIAARHKIKFVPSLFDDCAFGINHDPSIGKQPEPLEGWYAWAWSPSPGHSMVIDAATHPKLVAYVKAVIGHFKNDDRILFWDLYNEPTNGGLGSASFPLLKKVVAAAREVNPSQPLTIDVFDRNKRLNDIIFAASDLITFHNYDSKDEVIKQIADLRQHNRPVVCTEWMNRPRGSTVMDILPVFYKEKVGCMLWGLVNGKTQTDLPWGHRPGDPPPPIWQHDLYRGDFTPYDPKEISIIEKYIRYSKGDSAVSTYVNPVFNHDFPDPNLVKGPDGYFYAYSTQVNWQRENFGGRYTMPILRSKDLVQWEPVGDALPRKPDWKKEGGIWAPDAVQYKGTYYVYYSFSTWGDPNPGIGVATAKDPKGPFTDHGKLLLSKEVGVDNSIDPFFFEEAGKPYLVWGSFHGIYGIALEDDGLKIKGQKFPLAGNDFEGSYLYKRNGFYYYFGSVGRCCEGANSNYHVMVGRSKNFRGPYVDREGKSLMEKGSGTLVLESNDGERGFVGPGHNGDIITDKKGDTWMLYHSYDKVEPVRRVMLLDKVEWNGGWPVIAGREPSQGIERGPVFGGG